MLLLLAYRTIPTHVGRTRSSPRSSTTPTDHPHARGENTSTRRWRNSKSGPSPRTWGELASERSELGVARTIPTHVGRTIVVDDCLNVAPDHPHARGENSFGKLIVSLMLGPSPRTWGERLYVVRKRQESRTIPTHVGRTSRDDRGHRSGTDHPHARGENAFGRRANAREPGPSPRTWGEQCEGREPKEAPRTIPTHVGRTPHRSRTSAATPDHPHARGENVML